MTEPRATWPGTRAQFTVHGNPVPKARPRVISKGNKTWTYTPKRSIDWEERVGWAYREAQGAQFDGTVSITLRFFRRTRRKTDLDNLIKAVLDGLNGIAWADDAQVRHLAAELRTDKDDPRVEVTIEHWNGGDTE